MPPQFLVQPPAIDRTICEYLCAEKIKSFAISETQKFGHVTYFWNGNRSGYIDEDLELYVEIPSDRVEFDKAPKMKAFEIKDKTIEILKSDQYAFGRLNFANGDMVGHTGDFEAAKLAVSAVDEQLGKILAKAKENDYAFVLTSDHGNCEEMKDADGNVLTNHTVGKVWCFVEANGVTKVEAGGLNNIAPTVLKLMDIEIPSEMDNSLI